MGVIVVLGALVLVGCSTTADDPPEPWDESLAHDMCDPSIEGTSSCEL
jgi:hypothetical protein